MRTPGAHLGCDMCNMITFSSSVSLNNFYNGHPSIAVSLSIYILLYLVLVLNTIRTWLCISIFKCPNFLTGKLRK